MIGVIGLFLRALYLEELSCNKWTKKSVGGILIRVEEIEQK